MAQWMGACDSWWSLMMFGVFYRIVRNDADVDVLDCSWFFLYLAGHADREASPDCSILLSQRFPATNGGPYSKERTAALFVIYPPLRVELHCSILECVSPIIYDCACNTNTISLWLLFWNRNYIYIIYIYINCEKWICSPFFCQQNLDRLLIWSCSTYLLWKTSAPRMGDRIM